MLWRRVEMVANAHEHGPWSPPICFDDLELLRVLGQGGMGTVHLAYDRRTDGAVAVKFLTPKADDPFARPRFEREIAALARVRHPNVLELHRTGTVDGRPYVVTELVSGPRVDELARPSTWMIALHVGRGAARALAATHAAGVLHRDVKPTNLMLTVNRDVKLIDYGLARELDAAPEPGVGSADPGSELTQVGNIVGTPRYLSPEVWMGEPASPASDIHALGMVLYEMLAGRLPFADLRGDAIAHAMRDQDLPALTSRLVDLPRPLTALVDRMVARDPAARPAAAADVVAELDAFHARHLDEAERLAPLLLRPRVRPIRRPTAYSAVTASAMLAKAS